jgi:pimeloyl-ACP methyl ester carboxylesterase
MADADRPVAKASFGRLFAVSLLLAALILAPVAAQSAVKTKEAGADASRPHVYLMRGLLNIFSLGMDQLAVQIANHGVEAVVYNHSVEDAVVADIVQKYRAGDRGPYILVGHSLGADAVMTMAQQLNGRGVPVALVVPFDGTGSYAASPNVACVLNITQRLYAYMTPGAGFHGKLSNVNVSSDTSIDHFTIDKSPRLQAQALNAVLQAAHGETCRPGANAPAVARLKQAPAPAMATPATPVVAPTKSASPMLRSRDEG